MKRLLASAVLAALPLLGQSSLLAQTPAPNLSTLVGSWQGTVTAGNDTTRLGVVFTDAVGGVAAQVVIIDQDGAAFPVQQVTLNGGLLRLDVAAIRGVYEGTLSPNGQEIAGMLTPTGGRPIRLILHRVSTLDPPPTFAEAELTAVHAVIDAYFRAFTERNYEAMKATFQAPYVIWGVGSPPTVFATADEAVARLRRAREALEGTEYAVSRVARSVVTPLSANTALVDIHWRRDKKDGTLLGEGTEILPVIRTPNGWRITGNMARTLSQFGKSFP